MATRKAKTIPIVKEDPHQCCKNCRHMKDAKGEGFYCQRFPPSFVYDPSSGLTDSCWPSVDPAERCGEWTPHLSS